MTRAQRRWAARGLWLLLAANLALVLVCWAWNSCHSAEGNLFDPLNASILLAFGRAAGLLAAFLLLLQFMLIGRLAWIERVFGPVRLAHAHHVVGALFLLCLVAHPLLLVAHFQDEGWWAKLLDFWQNWDYVALAILAALIFLVVCISSWQLARRHLRYEWWMLIHVSVYVALALAFAHQIAVGGDFVEHPRFAAYWIGLYLFVAVNYAWYRALRPLLLFARHRFRVVRVAQAAEGITSVYIGGRRLPRWRAQAGQFVLVRFLAPGMRWFAHPFSLSTLPDGSVIRLTIKALGDYTRMIPQLTPGTRVIIEGPLGVFTADTCRRGAAVLVAGGIGITPLYALAQEFSRRNVPWTLLYSVRRLREAALADELETLARTCRFGTVHLVSDDENWPGERGRIDQGMLARLVPDIAARDVFICGPPPMLTAIRRAAAALGVPRRAIHYERFAL